MATKKTNPQQPKKNIAASMPAPRLLNLHEEPYCILKAQDNDSEFIEELSGLITKWNSRPGTEPQAFAKAYKKVLANYLNPDEAE